MQNIIEVLLGLWTLLHLGISSNIVYSGLIHEGDELREVNGIPMRDKHPEEILPILVRCLTFPRLDVSPCFLFKPVP